ncbi:hypothetical protein ACP8HI_26255 [Paenibacillus sp. FA6]|uniref:hypothetical protein n=1 Tax=Paenibacillus sp. FA6 TaxID=3413029 RepID=UPI003F660422
MKHIRVINQLSEISVARLQQISLQGKLQETLPPELYPLLLEYEGAMEGIAHCCLLGNGLVREELYREFNAILENRWWLHHYTDI